MSTILSTFLNFVKMAALSCTFYSHPCRLNAVGRNIKITVQD